MGKKCDLNDCKHGWSESTGVEQHFSALLMPEISWEGKSNSNNDSLQPKYAEGHL